MRVLICDERVDSFLEVLIEVAPRVCLRKRSLGTRWRLTSSVTSGGKEFAISSTSDCV